MFENEAHYIRKCLMLILMETRISKHGNRMCGMKLGNTNETAYLLHPNVIFIYTLILTKIMNTVNPPTHAGSM